MTFFLSDTSFPSGMNESNKSFFLNSDSLSLGSSAVESLLNSSALSSFVGAFSISSSVIPFEAF